MKRILLYYIDSKKNFNVFPLKLIIKLTLILKHLDWDIAMLFFLDIL